MSKILCSHGEGRGFFFGNVREDLIGIIIRLAGIRMERHLVCLNMPIAGFFDRLMIRVISHITPSAVEVDPRRPEMVFWDDHMRIYITPFFEALGRRSSLACRHIPAKTGVPFYNFMSFLQIFSSMTFASAILCSRSIK